MIKVVTLQMIVKTLESPSVPRFVLETLACKYYDSVMFKNLYLSFGTKIKLLNSNLRIKLIDG